ncbi:MAG: pyruvate formate lyase family protein, partial [Candidatus Latescibacteria bacterium]|nr:pyruvate formate lyase family protein [Candidatus Latescibacterota bacterium]
MQLLDLDPGSRSHALREMYWNDDHEGRRETRFVAGSETPGLVGKARDFQILLEATPVVMQPVDLLVGVSLVVPAEGSSIDLGEYDGHYTPGNANILQKGLAGIRDRADDKLATETDPEKCDFLEATSIAYGAVLQFVERHATHVEALADEEADPTRRQELTRAAASCRELVAGPPTSFQAGLQMMWFTFMFGARGSIGRFDQWMYPLYRADIDSGNLTQEQAQELLENYFVKLNYFAGNNDSLRNIALAGQTPQGEDACNELTDMCLLAGGKLMLPEPKLNVRFHAGSPPELLELSCRLTCKGLSN